VKQAVKMALSVDVGLACPSFHVGNQRRR
jgi:hypothetical protein